MNLIELLGWYLWCVFAVGLILRIDSISRSLGLFGCFQDVGRTCLSWSRNIVECS